jgi:Methyltransferase domain
LNALAKITSASTYLEIGVAKGATFTRVTVPYKVGVDPKFQFDVHAQADPNTIFHEVTSDAFFTTLASAHGNFDLIYLDGLHTFAQTFRDFCASLRHAHAQTLWLLDDTHPSGWLAAHPDPGVTRRLHKLFRIRGEGRWMGDVYKVVFLIHDFFPQYTYATFPDHGQTVVWLETRQSFTPTWNSLERISRLGYRDFLRFRDSHLSIMEAPQILEAVEKSRNKLA